MVFLGHLFLKSCTRKLLMVQVSKFRIYLLSFCFQDEVLIYKKPEVKGFAYIAETFEGKSDFDEQ